MPTATAGRLSHRGSVLIQGRRAPIVGLVCMDMIMVDVTDLAPVQVGETVTLIGQQGEESIWADEVAGWIDTIPYEVLAGSAPVFHGFTNPPDGATRKRESLFVKPGIDD